MTKIASDEDNDVHTAVWTLYVCISKIAGKLFFMPRGIRDRIHVASIPQGKGPNPIKWGRDRRLLDPGVFLTIAPGDHNHSLPTRAAYWAGGTDPWERGDLLVIKTLLIKTNKLRPNSICCMAEHGNSDESVWSFVGQDDGEIAWSKEDESKPVNVLETSIPVPHL